MAVQQAICIFQQKLCLPIILYCSLSLLYSLSLSFSISPNVPLYSQPPSFLIHPISLWLPTSPVALLSNHFPKFLETYFLGTKSKWNVTRSTTIMKMTAKEEKKIAEHWKATCNVYLKLSPSSAHKHCRHISTIRQTVVNLMKKKEEEELNIFSLFVCRIPSLPRCEIYFFVALVFSCECKCIHTMNVF